VVRGPWQLVHEFQERTGIEADLDDAFGAEVVVQLERDLDPWSDALGESADEPLDAFADLLADDGIGGRAAASETGNTCWPARRERRCSS
jgi:hypothetical protein